MREIGVVLSGVEPLQLKALFFGNEGMPIWHRLVFIPYDGGRGEKSFLVGVVNYFKGLNSLYDFPDTVKTLIHLGSKVEILRSIKKHKEHLIVDIKVLTAFEVQDDGLERIDVERPVEVGTPVYRLTDEHLRIGDNYCYLGRFYGEDILQPLYIKDFQTLGEAYHFVVAGQTGSGKSTLVLKLLSLYAKESAKEKANKLLSLEEELIETEEKLVPKRSPMKFLILTPVPEFTVAFKEGKTSFGLNVKKVFETYGYKIETYSTTDLAFGTYDALRELLKEASFWNNYLGIRGSNNRETAIWLVYDFLKKQEDIENLPKYLDELIEYIKSDEFITRVYKGKDQQEDLRSRLQRQSVLEGLSEELLNLLNRFSTQSKVSIKELIWKFVSDSKGRVLVINLGTESRSLQYMLLSEVITHLRAAGNKFYTENPDLNLNTLVVLEEAHNFVPAKIWGDDEKLKQLKDKIITAYAETRKFGIGWMAITTRLSLIDRHVFEHSRVKIIGYGLATGSDRELLRESFGSEFVERYVSLADPSDPVKKRRRHVFLISGPITILSRRDPEFVEVFSTPEEFLEKNKIPTEDLLFFWPELF